MPSDRLDRAGHMVGLRNRCDWVVENPARPALEEELCAVGDPDGWVGSSAGDGGGLAVVRGIDAKIAGCGRAAPSKPFVADGAGSLVKLIEKSGRRCWDCSPS